MYTDTTEAAKKILDVFGGADGGIEFANFYHGFLPRIQGGSATEEQLRKVVLNFANLLEAVK
jgi:hypothetical protein